MVGVWQSPPPAAGRLRFCGKGQGEGVRPPSKARNTCWLINLEKELIDDPPASLPAGSLGWAENWPTAEDLLYAGGAIGIDEAERAEAV